MASLGNFLNVTDIRGSVGGNTYTKAKSGATLRARVKGRNPRSTRQSVARETIALVSRTAQGLGSSDVLSWKDYAGSLIIHNKVSGQPYHPSWMQAFMSLGVPYIGMNPGGTPPSAPPASPFVGDVITVTSAGASGKVTFTGSAANSMGIETAFYVQKLPSPNREANPHGYTLEKWEAIPGTPFHVDVTGLSPGVYATGYKFGETATGQVTLPVFLGNVIVT